MEKFLFQCKKAFLFTALLCSNNLHPADLASSIEQGSEQGAPDLNLAEMRRIAQSYTNFFNQIKQSGELQKFNELANVKSSHERTFLTNLIELRKSLHQQLTDNLARAEQLRVDFAKKRNNQTLTLAVAGSIHALIAGLDRENRSLRTTRKLFHQTIFSVREKLAREKSCNELAELKCLMQQSRRKALQLLTDSAAQAAVNKGAGESLARSIGTQTDHVPGGNAPALASMRRVVSSALGSAGQFAKSAFSCTAVWGDKKQL